MVEVDRIRAKYRRLRHVMDERVARLWAATEAEALGYGGIAAVVEATGISKSRVRAGLRDLAEQTQKPPKLPARAQRIRRPGAGRPPLPRRVELRSSTPPEGAVIWTGRLSGPTPVPRLVGGVREFWGSAV